MTGIINIEKELKTLRSKMQGCERGPSLFNLIIYTQEERRTQNYSELVSRIVEKFPCRVIFIQKDKDSKKDYINSSVSILSGGKNNGFACDQININVGGKETPRISFILLPSLVPDLPTYLLWGEDPCNENTLLADLEKLSDCIIFDSESTDNLPRFCQTMLEYLSNKAEVIDLNWARMGGWREILTKAFDCPEKIRSISTSKLLQISYSCNPDNSLIYHPEAQAIYMQAWVAAQLNWTFTSWTAINDITRINYQNSLGHPVIVEVCPHIYNELPAGSILSVEISSEWKHFFAIFTRKEASAIVTGSLSNDEKCELPLNFLLPNYQQRVSFLMDIFYGVRSPHYLNMLNILAQQDTSL